METVSRDYPGPEFLCDGFRPLFLAAGVWAAISGPLWIGVWSGAVHYPGLFEPTVWHIHEMLFGFVTAALGGFLLTAVPNWTGCRPLRGLPLAALACAWLAGRAAIWAGETLGPGATAAIDLAFIGALLLFVANAVLAAGNWRNLPVIAGVTALFLANLLFHLAAAGVADTGDIAVRLAVGAMAFLMSLIGGRIVPAFTRNWFAQHSGPEIAAPMQAFDRAILAVTALALLAWIVSGPAPYTGLTLAAAGALHLFRLARWRGWRAAAEPLVLVLHAGYLWLCLGLGLLGLSMLDGPVPQTLAFHVLTIGAMGTMTLAVMTRAILGHTGRALCAGPGTTAIYALASLAVLARTAFEFASELALLWMTAAAWSLAFALFTVLYGPLLFRPRRA